MPAAALQSPPVPDASSATPPAEEQSDVGFFEDPLDGKFDLSRFLSTRTGFLPLAQPITEPALGFGIGGGLVFFHDKPRTIETPDGVRVVPPNATFVGGFLTEDDSWGGFAGHLHTWNDGATRYLVGGGYASLHLDWFGEGDSLSGESIPYEINSWAFLQKLTFRGGKSDFFFGAKQRVLVTEASFDTSSLPGDIESAELDSSISGLGPTISYDTRNSLFSPTQGTKATLEYLQYDDAIGSDYDYGSGLLEGCHYIPLSRRFTLGLRGAGEIATAGAPFYDLASVHLRGIEAGRYVDNVALTLEAELRWDVATRWSLVGFGGAGWVADEFDQLDDADAHPAGGVGFRYLVAREYDLRIGLDVATSEDNDAIYVTVGTGWLRD